MGYLSQFLTDVFLCLLLALPYSQEMLLLYCRLTKAVIVLIMSQYCSHALFPHR